MSKRTADVSIAAIDRVLATGFRWLAFPPALEARFEADTGWARCRFLIATGLATLVLFNLFLLRDFQLIGDVFREALAVRLGIVTPLALAMLLVFTRNPPAWLREGMEAALMVLVIAVSLFLFWESRSPLAAHAHYALPLGIIFMNIIHRVRFWYASVASLLSVLLCIWVIPQIVGLPAEAASGAIMAFASAAFLTMIANYKLEHEQRHIYLTGLRETLVNRELADANRELSAMSDRDPLTGLSNRRHLERFLDALWAEEAAAGRPVACIMLDIDHFKRYNDRYGHLAGDDCLKAVGEIIRAHSRADADLAARYGGEEFLVVLPDVDLNTAMRIAERVRWSVEDHAIPHHTAPEGIVTISIGVAAARPRDFSSYHELIATADGALYGAKESGRNCVHSAVVPAAEPSLVPAGELHDPVFAAVAR
jgi:diguanylate cyclase (GGDEF)-like protein